jgi:hypothetical protein
MTATAQEQSSLSLTQHGVLRAIGECSGAERIRRLFGLFFPGSTYEKWAKQKGFALPTVKAAFSYQRVSGAKVDEIRERFAKDCGLPLDLVFIDPRPFSICTG